MQDEEQLKYICEEVEHLEHRTSEAIEQGLSPAHAVRRFAAKTFRFGVDHHISNLSAESKPAFGLYFCTLHRDGVFQWGRRPFGPYMDAQIIPSYDKEALALSVESYANEGTLNGDVVKKINKMVRNAKIGDITIVRPLGAEMFMRGIDFASSNQYAKEVRPGFRADLYKRMKTGEQKTWPVTANESGNLLTDMLKRYQRGLTLSN